MKKSILCLFTLLFLGSPGRLPAQSVQGANLGMALLGLLLGGSSDSPSGNKDNQLFEGNNYVGYGRPIEALNDSVYGDASDCDMVICCFCDTDKNTSHFLLILSDDDYNSPLQNSLLSRLVKCSSPYPDGTQAHYGTAVVSFKDAEQFTVPYYFEYESEGPDGPTCLLSVYLHSAYGSTVVEEIGTKQWNGWNTLKFLNSRLTKKNIDFIVLKEMDGTYIGYIEPLKETADIFQILFKRLGDKLGNHDFYKSKRK